MKKVRNSILGIVIMIIMSLICLLVVSFLTYKLKWQADAAMLGITLTYILAGFFGGLGMKWIPLLWKRNKVEIVEKESIGVTEKIVESILTSALFIILLWIVSLFLTEEGMQFSGRLFIIWMLLMGSVALGRIL